MTNRAQAVSEDILETGNLTLQVDVIGDSEVELSGTFGSVVLGTSTNPALAERTITTGERFESHMSDMLFTLTGTGPVTVRVRPMKGDRVLNTKLT